MHRQPQVGQALSRCRVRVLAIDRLPERIVEGQRQQVQVRQIRRHVAAVVVVIRTRSVA